MVEPEVAYATLDEQHGAGRTVHHLHREAGTERRRSELETIGRDIAKLEKITRHSPASPYTEAVEMLQQGFDDGN